MIQQRLTIIECDIEEQKGKSEKMVKTSKAIEVSQTVTQRDVDDFKKQMHEFKVQRSDNKKLKASLQAKLHPDEQQIKDLSKQAVEEEMSGANVATMVEIQGVPENPREDLKLIVRQIFYDTGVKVEPKEIDEVYHDGTFNKR